MKSWKKKYNLSNTDELDFPDYQDKTEFIIKSVRSNLAKADGRILSYDEAKNLVENSLNAELP